MWSSFGASLIAGLLLSTGVSAGPLKAIRQPESLSKAVLPRTGDVEICSLNVGWQKNAETLFAATVAAAAGAAVADAHVKVDCAECSAVGTVVVSGIKTIQNQELLGEIVSPDDDVTDLVEALGVTVRIELGGISAHIVADIDFDAAASYSLAIFTSDVIDAVALDESVKISLMVYLDLVFALTAEVDVTAGIDVLLPVGAYVDINALTGAVVGVNLEGVSASGTGVTVRSGEATLDLVLRARVELGTEVSLSGEQVYFELAAFVDLCDYTAVLVKSVDCLVELVEYFSVDIGVKAELVANLDFIHFAVAVDICVPQYTAALPTLCLSGPSSTGVKGVPGVQPTGSASGSVGTGGPSSSASSSSGAAGPGITPAPSMSRIPSGRLSNTSTTLPSGMTTSTVFTTVTSTITYCSQTVVNCPATAKFSTVVTSTIVQTVVTCPVGAQVTPTTAPSSSASIAPVIPVSPVTFVPVPTTGASSSIAAGPVPTQTAPLTTSTPFPFSNSTLSTPSGAAPATVAGIPVAVTSVAVVQPVPATSSPAVASTTSPSKAEFTGAATRGSASVVFGVVLAIAAAVISL